MVNKIEEISCKECNRVKIPDKSTTKKTDNYSIFDKEVSSKYTNINTSSTVTDLFGFDIGFCEVSCDSTPKIKKINNADRPFELEKELTIKIKFGQLENTKKITIPKGYTWDGASIPKWLQWLIGRNDEPKFAVASMVHDVLCENKDAIEYNRALSSGIFKSLLIANGVGKLKASIMAYAVDVYQAFSQKWKSNIFSHSIASLKFRKLAHA